MDNDWFSSVATRALEGQIESARRYRDWLEDLSPPRGRGSGATLTESYLRFAREVVDSTIDWYESVRVSARTPDADWSTSDRRHRERATGQASGDVLRLHGPVGARLRGTFIVDNHHARPTRVTFLLSPFSLGDGPSPFWPAMTIDPPEVTVPPGGEQPVTLDLHLDRAQFVAGRQYRGTLLVRGVGERSVQIVVEVSEAHGRSSGEKVAPGDPA